MRLCKQVCRGICVRFVGYCSYFVSQIDLFFLLKSARPDSAQTSAPLHVCRGFLIVKPAYSRSSTSRKPLMKLSGTEVHGTLKLEVAEVWAACADFLSLRSREPENEGETPKQHNCADAK